MLFITKKSIFIFIVKNFHLMMVIFLSLIPVYSYATSISDIKSSLNEGKIESNVMERANDGLNNLSNSSQNKSLRITETVSQKKPSCAYTFVSKDNAGNKKNLKFERSSKFKDSNRVNTKLKENLDRLLKVSKSTKRKSKIAAVRISDVSEVVNCTPAFGQFFKTI